MKVLISGASIAGPSLAYWLARQGHAVTVVERAPALRRGGYAVDIRGAALQVMDGLTAKGEFDTLYYRLPFAAGDVTLNGYALTFGLTATF